jgi:DNA mismatch repair protein MutL
LPWARPRQTSAAPLPLAPRLGDGSEPHRFADGDARENGRDREQANVPVGKSFFAELRYIGQLDRTYLLCESAGELVLIDQHAAHERVEFQRLRERFREHAVPVQRLLFPQRVELDPGQAAAAEDSRTDLAAVGFELEPFGGASFAIQAVPAGLRGEAEPVLRELLDELAACDGSRAVDDRMDAVFATIACHSVVRAGDPLGVAEVDALLIEIAEIARRFGR